MIKFNKYILSKEDYFLDILNNKITIYTNKELKLDNFALITNITTNVIIYNPHCEGLGGTLLNNTLTLDTKLSEKSSNTDELLIILYLPNEKRNESIEDTLNSILTELKINNKYLSELVGDEISEDDIN